MPNPNSYLSSRTSLCLVFLTVLAQAALLLTSVRCFLFPEPSVREDAEMWVALSLGGGTFMANVALVAFAPRSHARRTNVYLAAVFLVLMAAWWWASGYHIEIRRRAFVSDRMLRYDGVVRQLVEKKNLLTSKPLPVSSLAHQNGAIWAYTNTDGSITVLFAGRDNNLRTGYLYSSGPLLNADPTNPTNPYFHHLTNGWYEY